MTLRYMAFNVPVVFNYLKEHNHVLTVRGFDYRTEYAKVADLDVTIQRVQVCEINQENDLAGFVALSGFKTTRQWWQQIKRLCKGRMWLYRVTTIDEEGLSPVEREREEKELQRMFEEQNAWSNEEEIAEILSHPLDIRTEPVLRDPALVDLQPFRVAVHEERIEREDAAIQRKHERMRELFGEQMCAAPTPDTHDPERIKSVSSAELALKELCGA